MLSAMTRSHMTCQTARRWSAACQALSTQHSIQTTVSSITQAGSSLGVGCVCESVSVCPFVCPCSKSKMVWAINIKVDRDIVHRLEGSRHELTQSSKGQKTRSQGYQVQTVCVMASPVWVGLHVDMTAHFTVVLPVC